jgi:hypothetical protein
MRPPRNLKPACASVLVPALLVTGLSAGLSVALYVVSGFSRANRAIVSAQMRVRPVDLEDGSVALGLMLRRLDSTGVFMQATAHPDDENNALHVFLNRGKGVRTILATATRGDGGQNEIGPEIFDALAVLRTEELEAVHRFDASEQYFTRAVDSLGLRSIDSHDAPRRHPGHESGRHRGRPAS